MSEEDDRSETNPAESEQAPTSKHDKQY